MPEKNVEYLLIGGGIASAYCAYELRRRGAEGEILLVGREPEPPYDRPPLSKEYLRGESERSDTYIKELSWYEDNEVELLTKTNVTGLDVEQRIAKVQGLGEVGFEKALLATGANVNILRVDGAQLEGIHYLRAFGNSDAIRKDTADAERVVLIGGSYIGTEVAASLTSQGRDCTILMQEDVVLSTGFGDEAGSWFQDLLLSKGVEIVGGVELESYLGEDRVRAVRTSDGREFECDAVIVGAGVMPDTMLAERAGIEVGDGIICDSGLETSVEGIFAAGDCCNYESELHGRRIRVEHTDLAMHQGRHAARGLAGDKSAFTEVPYFYSDLADWAGLEYVGPAKDWDQEIWRGDRDKGEFSVWYLKDGRLAGALAVGRSEDLSEARRMLAEGVDLSGATAALADAESDLSQIG